MKGVRRDVMMDYLHRASSDPNCTDIRVVRSRPNPGSKRKRTSNSADDADRTIGMEPASSSAQNQQHAGLTSSKSIERRSLPTATTTPEGSLINQDLFESDPMPSIEDYDPPRFSPEFDLDIFGTPRMVDSSRASSGPLPSQYIEDLTKDLC